jgi:hypothetical protein
MNSDNKSIPSPGPIVSFYREEGTDGSGRKLSQILAWDDTKLEAYHDFIQWLFPLTEGSRAVPGSPVLQQAEIQAFKADPALQARLNEAFRRMLAFYKFDYSQEGGEIKISPRPDWSSRKPHWLNKGNHNHLRITRILKSLTILGLPEQAQAFYQALVEVYRNYKDDIGYNTFQYWKGASGAASK